MSEPTAPENRSAVRKLFYGRLAEHCRDLNLILSDLAVQIDQHRPDKTRVLLIGVESKTETMRSILTAFENYFED